MKHGTSDHKAETHDRHNLDGKGPGADDGGAVHHEPDAGYNVGLGAEESVTDEGTGEDGWGEAEQEFASSAFGERFIDVAWDPDAQDTEAHTGRISVIAAHEPGAIASVSNAVYKYEGSVTNLKVVNRQQDFCEILLDVEVRDLRHLSTVIAGLRAVRGVTEVGRARA